MWEIVYLGIMPEVRGHGFGLDATRSAQWFARRAASNEWFWPWMR